MWKLFVINLPGRHQAVRMRIWRMLKAAGAGAIRDGVYLLPAGESAREVGAAIRRQIVACGGTAQVLDLQQQSPAIEAELRGLFDRSASYGSLLRKLDRLRVGLSRQPATLARRTLRTLNREFEALRVTDHFPGPAQEQLRAGMQDVESLIGERFVSGEPRAVQRSVARRDAAAYRNRTWGTRANLWVDRVASAWLIRRFIDRKAKFVWLNQVGRIPRGAVGFDFNGAEFTHIGALVTFEVLLRAFGLEGDGALRRIAAIVHYLDVGGVPVPEAGPVEVLLRQIRRRTPADDRMLRESCRILDDLHAGFTELARGGSP